MTNTILLSTASARSSCTIDPTEIAFSDFKNGVYRLNGSTVTLADLWAENTDWGTFVPETAITPGTGLVASADDSPTATTALFNALWPNGFVALLTVAWFDVTSTMIFDLYTGTTFAEEYRVNLQSNSVLADYKPTQDGLVSVVADPGAEGNLLRSMFRMTPTKISAMHATGPSSVYRRPGATPNLTKFSIGLNNGTMLRDITFFSPDVPFMDLLV